MIIITITKTHSCGKMTFRDLSYTKHVYLRKVSCGILRKNGIFETSCHWLYIGIGIVSRRMCMQSD